MHTKATVEATLLQVCKDNERTVNPDGQEGCLYTDERGRHCVAGEVATQLGVEVPAYGHPDNSIGAEIAFEDMECFTPDALALLCGAQRIGDNYVPWGEIPNRLREQGVID